mgnify:CR=1 FL=1
MPAIILPDRWRRQPTGPVEIDWTHPAARALISVGIPTLKFDPITREEWSNYAGDLATVGGAGGVSWQNAGNSNSSMRLADSAANSTSKAIVVSIVDVAASSGDYSAVSKRVDFGQGWLLMTRFSALKGNNYPTFAFFDGAGWRSTTGTMDIRGTGPRTLVGAYDGSTVRCFVDGIPQGESSHTGSLPDTAATLKVCGDGESSAVGRVSVAYMIDGNKVTADAALSRELSLAPWAIFKKKAKILYFPSAGGGGATIAGDSLTHAHSLSSPSLTQSNVLAVQGVAQSHSLGAPALTQHNVLAVNAIAQAHALGNVTLTQAHILTVQGIGQAHSLGAPSLTQHNALTPAPLTQAQTLGNVTLTIAGSIAAANIAQGHSIGTPALTQHHVLTVAALMQAQSLGQPALAQAGTLAVDGMTQAQVLDALALVQHHALAVQALLQGHALGNVTLTASDALAIDGLTHAQILGSPSLTQHNVLAAQNMTHAQILQAVTLGGLVIGSLRGTLVAYSLLDGEVVCRALLSGSLETVH